MVTEFCCGGAGKESCNPGTDSGIRGRMGRAWGHAVAARGEAGVAHRLSVMRQEMEVALAPCGATEVAAVDGQTLLRGGDGQHTADPA